MLFWLISMALKLFPVLRHFFLTAKAGSCNLNVSFLTSFSPAFVSPEVVIAPLYDGAAVDMWALGVCLYILLTGNFPFQDSQ